MTLNTGATDEQESENTKFGILHFVLLVLFFFVMAVLLRGCNDRGKAATRVGASQSRILG